MRPTISRYAAVLTLILMIGAAGNGYRKAGLRESQTHG